VDQSQFDRIARLLGAGTSRRSGVRAFVGTLLGASVAAEGADATREANRRHEKMACRNANSQCVSDDECCSGTCVEKFGGIGFRCAKTHGKKKNKRRGGADLVGVPTGEPCNGKTDYCIDSEASCVDYDSGDPAGTYCLLPAGASCGADQGYTCASQVCPAGTCVAGVPTGDQCTAQESFCVNPAATCQQYVERMRNGQYTNLIYCLLPEGSDCAADIDCASDFCDSGVCAYETCTVCANGCPYSSLDVALAEAGTGSVIRVAQGEWFISHAGGGTIDDGRVITVRACNGAAVSVTSLDWTTFLIGDCATGGGTWILEGLDVYNSTTSEDGGSTAYLSACTADAPAALIARNTTFRGNGNSWVTTGIAASRNTDITLEDCQIKDFAADTATGIIVYGSAPRASTLTMLNSTVTGIGTATSGTSGALLVCVTATITDSEFSGNFFHTGIGRGAGMTIGAYSCATSVTLDGTTTIRNNSATASSQVRAGGILIQAHGDPAKTVTLSIGPEASVTGNSSISSSGSGINVYNGVSWPTNYTITGGDRVTNNSNPTDQCVTSTGNYTATTVPNCAY